MDHQPRPGVRPKKARRDRLIRLAQRHPDWLLGFADEVWWSRLAHPALHAWQEADHPMRLVAQTVARDDPDPPALACYGLLARSWDADQRRSEELWLRFVDGRPVSAVTIDFLTWCATQAQAQGKRAVLLIWDNASWHASQIVRSWVRQHTRQVKQAGDGVRLIVCYLPIKSPWLNPIEPQPSYNRDSADQPQGPGDYHGGASRPSSRRLHVAGDPALPPGRGAAVGDRAARREPAVCPGLLVHPAPGGPRERERSGDHDHDGWLTSVRVPRHPLESASAA